MTIDYKIWEFPDFKIESQLFHVPGSVFDGGMTSGGARIASPEPGGRSVLEMKIAYQIGEWDAPFVSWLMSKTAGNIFRVQLINTPQLSYKESVGSIPWVDGSPWDNDKEWNSDGFYLETTAAALEGSTSISVDLLAYGEILKHGHVLGHGDNCYIIDEIEYAGTVATITLNPPLRKNVSLGDMIYTRPYFLGTIANGAEMRATYEASKVGGIQTNRIIFNEVIL